MWQTMIGPEKEATAMGTPDKPQTSSFFENLSIQIKVFFRAGGSANLPHLSRRDRLRHIGASQKADLHFLSSSVVPKQRAFALVNDNVVAIEIEDISLRILGKQ